MALPSTNTTCDIYRSGTGPPSAPAVAGVRCHLEAHGQSTLTSSAYTHVLLLDADVDVRDEYAADSFGLTTAADSVWVPDQNGTEFKVVLVRRQGRGTPLDHKHVLLVRETPSWPTDDV
jgi:hypothetical protein